MPDPVYVTTGAWGAGGGVPLSAAEIDTNFYRVVQRIVSLETDPPIGPYVTSVALAGTSFTMGLSDGSTLGPITFTIPMPRWRGDWQPLTTYHALDGVWVNRAHRDVITVPYHPGAFSSNENFFYYIFPRDGYIPANFGTRDGYQSGSGGTVNATSSTVITASRAAAGDLSDFSETVGTITIAAGHVEGTFATNSGTVKNFSAGDVLRLRAPSSADGTFAGFYATLVFITA
jgi:hypothetical protein